MDLIRGRDVNEALATLRFARKSVARDIEKVLRSAIANAQQKEGFGGDVERLCVGGYANQGPSQKRIRPAPMGRAFRVVKRTAHLTVHVIERPRANAPVQAARARTTRPRGAKPKTEPETKSGRKRRRSAKTRRGQRARRRRRRPAARRTREGQRAAARASAQ